MSNWANMKHGTKFFFVNDIAKTPYMKIQRGIVNLVSGLIDYHHEDYDNNWQNEPVSFDVYVEFGYDD